MRPSWRSALPRIERDEVPLALSLRLLHFMVVRALPVARVARDGAFLSRLSVAYLPYVSVGLAAWMLLAAQAFGWLTRGASAARALSQALLATGLSLLLFAFWLRSGGPAAAVAFYLWTGAYGVLLVSQFWLLADEHVNPRQARRLFGIIGAAGILGGLTGGGLASFLGRAVGPIGLLVGLAVIHVVAAVMTERRGHPRDERGEGSSPGEDASGTLREALGRPYVRLLVMLFLAGGLASGVLDYQFKLALQMRSHEAGAITSTLGVFYAVENLLALGAQLGLASLLLSRFGVRNTPLSLPAGLLLGALGTVMAPAFPTVLLTRLYDATMRVSVARTAWEFLFFPLADAVRRPTRRFIDGVVNRSSDAVAGLLVLGLNAALGGTLLQLAVLVGALAALWVVAEIAVSRAYAREVGLSLERMLLGAWPVKASTAEVVAAGELAGLLDSDDERHVLYALDRLQTVDPEVLREKEGALLQHASERVKSRVLALRALWGAPVPAANATRVEETSAASPPAAADASLFEKDAARRRLAVHLDDPDPNLRRAAFQSLPLLGARESIALLVGRLAWPRDRKEARDALAVFGSRAVGTLGDYLADAGVPLN